MSNPPEELRPSEEIRAIRNEISDIRTRLTRLYDKSPWKSRLEHVEGALTCCLVALYDALKEIAEHEIKVDDVTYGRHLRFSNRGLGLEGDLKCFVCGTRERVPDGDFACMNNISGFVDNKADGAEIVSWFSQGARLDFRPSEPNWIQVKIGACDAHLPNLKTLSARTSRYGIIRGTDIACSMPAPQ